MPPITNSLVSWGITGLFFLASVAPIVGGPFWAGTTGTFQDSTISVSYFDSSVQGLATGSTVSYHGLKVATVQSSQRQRCHHEMISASALYPQDTQTCLSSLQCESFFP